MLRELIIKNRSVRRFDQSFQISQKELEELVDLARLSPSAANLQPLKFYLSWEPGENSQIFPYLAWAGYLKEWPGPAEGERPSAYIIILGDTNLATSFDLDAGIASMSIMLGATERGLGGCIIGSIQREGLRDALSIPERYKILLVLALGKPAEQIRLEEVGEDGDIRYWRDNESVHHVPKRSLQSIIYHNK
ncbi:MAG: nitroreductase family protein [bacterium]|nr:nitroreductase family protein [bacterium]